MTEDNVHKDHRKRMYARYDQMKFEGFNDHEVLEMLLFYVIKMRNTNDIAHALLNRFGSLEGVLNASAEKLVKVENVGYETARYLNMWGNAFKRSDYVKPPKNFRGDAAEKFLINLFKGKQREEMYIICLDPRDNILNCRMLDSGSFESAGIDVGKAIRTAIDYDSAQVVFAHNHPSGITVASNADINVTSILLSAMNLVGIRMRDHIIVAGEKCVSITREYNIKEEKIFKNWP
ncbi:MAG: hypothetical protein LUD03_02605 [Firmicutes bacterium]|nr:hypothetical protein [Bacillota bacterium]